VTTTTTEAAPTAHEPVDWLIDVLRGSNPSIRVSRRAAPYGHIELERYTVFPSESDPRLIITATSNRVRSAALRRVSNQSSSATKLLRRVGAELARTGLDQLAAGPDIVLSVDAGQVDEAPGDRSPVTLVEYLESSLGVHGLHIAVSNGPVRPNRKPVLQVMDADGKLLAFAKVGWNDSTRDMVQTEARVLNELSSHDFGNVEIPDVVHYGTWNDLVVLATRPLQITDDNPPSENLMSLALREVAHHRSRTETSLRASGWLAEITDRSWALNAPDKELDQLVARLANLHGETIVDVGFGHGDWAPWNMSRIGDRLGVWDWERASADVPLGLDLVHFHFQQAFHANGNNVGEAIDAVQPALVDGLSRLDIEAGLARVISVMYLIELALRYAESSLNDNPELTRTQLSLMTQIRQRVETADTLSPQTPKPAPRSQGGALFKRRMLGGSGVPAPLREAVKTTVRTWGHATADRRVLPNTFIIGAQRCGTTSLFRYLTQHQSVAGPMLAKGVHYFDTAYTGDLDWYRSHFPTVRSARLSRQRNGCDLRVLEAAPYYMFHPFVARRIAKSVPDARVIAVVRDPVDRALSHHNHEVKRGFEIESFARALEFEKERLDGEIDKMAADPTYVSYAHQHHSYVSRGLYDEQLDRYDSLLGAENLLVIRSVDLERDPAATVERALLFLGVPVLGSIKFPRFNARSYAAMDPGIEQELRERFGQTDAAMAERLGRTQAWS